MTRTSSVKVEGMIMSIDLNKENRVAAAGRKAFKIFSLDEYNNFIEEIDLRGNDTTNLNYSFNDVVWNLREDHVLATAATNGAIVLWNLHKQSSSKQDRVLLDHKRTVNRINFHFHEPWLLSGSQDGTIRCFDLRCKESGRIFNSNTDSIRDVKFSPHATTNFAAVSENGSVQLWDTRKHDKFYCQYAAHSEPIFACDWHFDYPWLATSSRDRTIKVWDINCVRPVLKYIIHTFSSVGRIKWRPHFRFHIASTALVVDRNINIWDIRRPYIPYACFKGHKDIATDIKWKSDPQYLLSSGRDSYIFQHVFSEAIKPADAINPQAMSVNSQGNILHTQRINVITTAPKPGGKIQGFLRKTVQVNESFCQAGSRLYLFTATNNPYADSDALFFIKCAVHYVLSGQPFEEMCDHNARIANQLGRSDVGFTWSIIKKIFTSNYFELDGDKPKQIENEDDGSENSQESGNSDVDSVSSVKELSVTDDKVNFNSENNKNNTINNGDNRNNKNEDEPDGGAINEGNGDSNADQDDVDETDETGEDFLADTYMPVGDFVFGDREMDPFCLDYDTCENLYFSINGMFADKFDLDENEWNLPTEAFAPRHEIKEGPLPPELLPTKIPTLTNYVNSLSHNKFVKTDTEPYVLSVKHRVKSPFWNMGDLISEALNHHADQGDFQTAVSILLVLGENRKFIKKKAVLDEMIQEQWLLSYLEMLNRFKLWNIATKVIQLSWISSVYQLNQLSTSMRTCCVKCRKLMIRCGWSCDRCDTRMAAVCGVCHQVVKGLYVWCQRCGHGGHPMHIRSWLRKNRYCPVGCGHYCEY